MSKKYKILSVALGILIAGMLRYYAALDNLLLDEIWSVEGARNITSWWQVFAYSHSNNHILNSLYLYFFAEGSWWPQYRLFSIITGSAAAGLMGWIGFKRNTVAGVLTLIFNTLSFPLIIWSSEARGYAPAFFFAALSFLAFQHYGQKAKWKVVLFFWFSIIAGILSHFVFVYIFAGFFVSSLLRSAQKKDDPDQKWSELFRWYVVPAGFILGLYFFFARNLEMSGGGWPTPTPVGRFSLFMNPALGLNPESMVASLGSLALFIAILFWLYWVERQKNKEWQFFNMVVGVVPALSFFLPLLLFNANYLSFTLPFLYLLLASLLAECLNRGKVAVVATLLIVLAFSFFSIREYTKQIAFGRGDYLGALSYMAKNTNDSVISITSDHDFRNGKLINFYQNFALLRFDQMVQYVQSADSSQAPEWMVIHEPDPYLTPPDKLIRLKTELYKLDRRFQNSTIISGWGWFVYRKEGTIQ